MPRIELQTPDGFNFTICTRNIETTLHAWFDEVLPWAFIPGRPGIDDFDVLWPRVNVWPMWAWKYGSPSDFDWLCDSRILGRLIDLPARNGDEGLAALVKIRRDLEAELERIKADGR